MLRWARRNARVFDAFCMVLIDFGAFYTLLDRF
jgi:hypothetical protein